jgi:hypothetical protein
VATSPGRSGRTVVGIERAQPVGGQESEATGAAVRRFRLASSRIAVALAVLNCAVRRASVPQYAVTRQNVLANAEKPALGLIFGSVDSRVC